MINLEDKDGNARWINVFPFTSRQLALSYVKKSSTPLRVIKADAAVFWACSPEDAEWAVKCGYKEVK
jgi:hypothetical protein